MQILTLAHYLGVVFILVAIVVLLTISRTQIGFGRKIILLLLYFLGSALVIFASFKSSWDRADINSRTTKLTGTVVKIEEERDDKWGKLFHLKMRMGQRYDQLPFTFSDTSGCFLKDGDVVTIKFVYPTNPEDKPDVLEYYNHSCMVYSFSTEKTSDPTGHWH